MSRPRSASKDFKPDPVVNRDWWKEHVRYWKFDRQGVEITCASFDNPDAKASIVLTTGWSETFLKYASIIRTLYEEGYNVYTYDHQSQGLSGRWLPDTQSTWVNTFDDYVNDYVYFVTRIIQNDRNKLKIYCLAHSMGGFIAAIAMARNPSIINKAVLCAPMLRMKCGTRSMNYRFPVPQPVAHWLAYLSWAVGLGTAHGVGYPNEVCTDKMARNTFTSDESRLLEMEVLRQKHPNAIATCVTNDWIRKSLELQIEFSRLYSLVRTNCLILRGTKDFFVYNRAMETFADQAGNARLATVEDAYHELLFESDDKRMPVENQIIEYFNQSNDEVSQLRINPLFDEYKSEEKSHLRPSLMSLGETAVRGTCLALGTVGVIVGLSMLTGFNTDRVYVALFKRK